MRPVQQDVQVEERPTEAPGRPQADQIQVQTFVIACDVFETNVDLNVFGLLGKHIFTAWTDE